MDLAFSTTQWQVLVYNMLGLLISITSVLVSKYSVYIWAYICLSACLVLFLSTDFFYETSFLFNRDINEKPYGSVAATFYLLAEAERHRRQSQGILPMAPVPTVNRKTLPQVQHHTMYVYEIHCLRKSCTLL